MRDIILDTIIASKHQLNRQGRKHCFELLGYDFLIDEDYRTWLLEVNNNPFLGYQNDEQYKLLTDMLNNLLELTLDPLLSSPNIKKSEVDGACEFKLIYSDYQNINERSSYSKNWLYPIPELN